MAKNKSKSADGVSKSERKALEAKEAALVAELAARTEVKPKSKGKAAPDLSTLKRKALKQLVKDKTNGPLRQAAKAELKSRDAAVTPLGIAHQDGAETIVKPSGPSAKSKTVAAAERVIAEPGSEGAHEAATVALEAATEASDDETDAQIKARVKAKREARAAAAALPVTAPGSARNDDALPDETEVDYQYRKAAEKNGMRKATTDELVVEVAGEHLAVPHVAEEVETERGRVFAVGETDETDDEPVVRAPDAAEARGFALPSESPVRDYEVNGNGQYKIKRLSDGKLVGYTRVTTYISTNEDRTLLERWKLRILLEGVAIDGSDDRGPALAAHLASLVAERDAAIAKATKADGKGKLALGQYGNELAAIWGDFRKAVDAIAEHLLELGGVHEKAAKGTQLHELVELYDREGIDAVGELVLSGAITNADLADVEAYGRAIEAAGIKIIPELIETPVVLDDLKVAGRLDRVVMARMPGAARAARYILDVKSGRIDLGAGKIAQQLELYSRGETYNLETHERGKHGASRTKGLILHLVPGSAEARILVVDLGLGRVGNELSGKVRTYRNEGKRAIDHDVDLAKLGAGS